MNSARFNHRIAILILTIFIALSVVGCNKPTQALTQNAPTPETSPSLVSEIEPTATPTRIVPESTLIPSPTVVPSPTLSWDARGEAKCQEWSKPNAWITIDEYTINEDMRGIIKGRATLIQLNNGEWEKASISTTDSWLEYSISAWKTRCCSDEVVLLVDKAVINPERQTEGVSEFGFSIEIPPGNPIAIFLGAFFEKEVEIKGGPERDNYLCWTAFRDCSVRFHKAEAGQTLSLLAKVYQVTPQQIISWNDSAYPSIETGVIQPGWTLLVGDCEQHHNVKWELLN